MKIDYPKISYPVNKDYFWNLVLLGKELRLLHTMDKTLSTEYVEYIDIPEGEFITASDETESIQELYGDEIIQFHEDRQREWK